MFSFRIVVLGRSGSFQKGETTLDDREDYVETKQRRQQTTTNDRRPFKIYAYSQVQNKRGGRLFFRNFADLPPAVYFDPPPVYSVDFSNFTRDYKEFDKYIIDS